MAVRGWVGAIGTAVGVAAGAGAAQLGLGYGLGIIAWLPSADGSREAVWVASLAWATWIAATSVIIGAVVADRLSAEPASSAATPSSAAPTAPASTLSALLWRLALAVAAAVGALVTVALVAVPSRAAERADTFSPQTIAAGYAVVGVLVGLLVAIGALSVRAVAANVLATVCWLWALAVVAVIDGVTVGRGFTTAQLGVWHFTDDGDAYWFRNMYLPGVALSLGSALVIGALAALPAARRADARVGVAVSGALGPLLVAAAYFLAAPRLVGVRPEQLSAYLVAPYAVIAGLAGSVLITAVRIRPRPADGGDPAASAVPVDPGASDEPAPAFGHVPAQRDGEGARQPAADLADDAYAPARAYASDTATAASTTAATTPVTEGSGAARGQAAVPKPVWPDAPAAGKAAVPAATPPASGASASAQVKAPQTKAPQTKTPQTKTPQAVTPDAPTSDTARPDPRRKRPRPTGADRDS